MELKDFFPSLSLFSDIDWKAVSEEYKISSQIMTFPEYLEMKAEEGDCPAYLFELAFFEEALRSLQESDYDFPLEHGNFLNPSACFLSLEFDVLKMLTLAQEGKIEIIEKKHILSVCVDIDGEIRFKEIGDSELLVLTCLEKGEVVASEFQTHLNSLSESGLVLMNK